jgi:Zn-dependent protease
MVAFTLIQLLTVFVCVTLHEYGHALAARRYAVETHDITLLPIGGVARLKQIPRVPIQEFVIAVAGPAVNVIIAMLLLALVFLTGNGWVFAALYEVMAGTIDPADVEAARGVIDGIFGTPTLVGYLLSIFTINVILVLFNMVPAFPMDGGRVLRSLLAMALPYTSATRWAQRIGMICAIFMAASALTSEPPRIVLLLIAGFIVFAGLAEVRQVVVRELVEGLAVGDVMTENVPMVRADMSIGQLRQWWRSHPNQTAAVVGINGIFLGQLRLRDLVNHLKQQTPGAGGILSDDGTQSGNPYVQNSQPPWHATAIDLADTNVDTLDVSERLEALLAGGKQTQREFAVIDDSGQVVGWLNLDTIGDRAALARLQPTDERARFGSIDQQF